MHRARTLDRRRFLHAGLAATAAAVAAPGWARAVATSASDLPPVRPGDLPYGPLQPPDANGLRLPPGFTSRVVGRSRSRVEGTDYVWHDFPDGGATFAARGGGWVYVSNSEVAFRGGVGAIRFSADGDIVGASRILAGTTGNCAGGPTPWGTWLSCEEHPRGQVWECDPAGEEDAVARPAMGTFVHEAVAVDPERRRLYLTEDSGTGCFYRFTPARWPNLGEGMLEAAIVDPDGHVTWGVVPDPGGTRAATQAQVPGSTRFRGGEGIWFDAARDVVLFATKGDDRVWAYDVVAEAMSVLYDARRDRGALSGVDNLVVSPGGELFVAEDGGNMELVMITTAGVVAPFLRLDGHARSELAGPAFDPAGTRLYVSSQRGLDAGVTFEVTGPFARPRAPTTVAPTTTIGGVPGRRSGAPAAGGAEEGGDAVEPALLVGGFTGLALLAAGTAAWRLRRRAGTPSV